MRLVTAMQGVLHMKRTLVGVIVAVIVWCGAFGGWPTEALAHADPISMFPADGAELNQPPNEVRISFSEPIVTTASRLIIQNAQGVLIPGANQSSPDAQTLVLTLPPLDNGVYTVAWEVLSTDTHTTTGQMAFAVAAALPKTVPITPAGDQATPQPAPGPTAKERGFPWVWVAVGTGVIILLTVGMRRR